LRARKAVDCNPLFRRGRRRRFWQSVRDRGIPGIQVYVICSIARAGFGTLGIFLALALLAARPAAATWSLQGNGGEAAGCWLESAVQEVETGYNRAKVKILIEKRRVVIESDAKLDEAYGDLGLKVDRKTFAGIDRVEGEHRAVIESDYEALIGQFKAGISVALQLRFWPTWPTTGTHDTEFSLVGFTKAYNGLAAC